MVRSVRAVVGGTTAVITVGGWVKRVRPVGNIFPVGELAQAVGLSEYPKWVDITLPSTPSGVWSCVAATLEEPTEEEVIRFLLGGGQ